MIIGNPNGYKQHCVSIPWHNAQIQENQKGWIADMEETNRKRGFYIALGAIIVCAFTVAVVYKNMQYTNQQQKLANLEEKKNNVTQSTPKNQMPEQSSLVADNSAGKESNATDIQAKDKTSTTTETKEKKNKKTSDTKKKDTPQEEQTADADETVETMGGSRSFGSAFNEEAGLLWPTEGEVLMKYSMDKGIYFQTLAQYKCNPALIISSKVGTEVKACAKCIVTDIKENEETGLTVTTALDDKYKVIYGQLKDVSASVGDELAEGDTIGKIAKPTKYYVTEGSNLYLQVMENDKTVDPLLLLR